MHIFSSIFIIISLNSFDCEVPEHYYIFVIHSVHCFMKLCNLNQYVYFEYEIAKYILIALN